MTITTFVILIFSFAALWVVSGLIVTHSHKIALALKLKSFLVSYFLLGFMTSIPEAAIGINAIIDDRPGIYVGNILGGISLLFMFIIPLLAVIAGYIKIQKNYRGKPLMLILTIVLLPFLLTIDGRITLLDSMLVIVGYGTLAYLLLAQDDLIDRELILSPRIWRKISPSIAVLLFSIGVMMLIGNLIVDETIKVATGIGLPTFFIGAILISVGTNFPELFLGVRSVVSGDKSVAYGNYLGSATINALLFGLFSAFYVLRTGEPIQISTDLSALFFIIVGLIAFYIFKQSRDDLTRKEGAVLLLLYILFLFTQIYQL